MNQLSSEMASMKTSFQGGVDTLYNKCKSRGATPSAKTPTAIASAIDKIYTDRYNAGFSAGEATFSGEIDLLLNGSIGSNNATITYDLGKYAGYKAIFLAAYYPSTLTFSNPQNVTAEIKSNGQLDIACFTNIKSNSTFRIYKYGTGSVNTIMYGIK